MAMSYFVIGLMTVCAVAAVAVPYLRARDGSEPKDVQWRLRELLAAKDTMYATLKELDFDRVAGKLSEADFRQLESQYRDRAIEVLREIDRLKDRPEETLELDDDLAEALEREILALRTATRADSPSPDSPEDLEEGDEPPARKDEDAPPEPRFCSQCGVPVISTDYFCFSCGARLRRDG